MSRKKTKTSPKKVLIFFMGIVGFVLIGGVLTRSPGEWVCQDGVWRAVGKPRGLPPSIDCRPTPTPTVAPTPTKNPSPGTPLEGITLQGGEIATDSVSTLPFGFQHEATEATR